MRLRLSNILACAADGELSPSVAIEKFEGLCRMSYREINLSVVHLCAVAAVRNLQFMEILAGWLADHPDDINLKTASGAHSLHWAIKYAPPNANIVSVVDLLLNAGVDVNTMRPSCISPLFAVMMRRGLPLDVRLYLIARLLRAGANINAKTSADNSVIEFATKLPAVECAAVINCLLINAKISYNDTHAILPLIVETYGDACVKIISDLLASKSGAIFMTKRGWGSYYNGITPVEKLMDWVVASLEKYPVADIAAICRRYNVDLDRVRPVDYMLVTKLLIHPNVDLANLVMRALLPMNVSNVMRRDYQKILDSCRNPQMFSLLIEHGMEVTFTVEESSLLHMAGYSANFDLIPVLARRVGVNVRNGNGKTILHVLVQMSPWINHMLLLRMVISMIEMGCDPNVRDSFGQCCIENMFTYPRVLTNRDITPAVNIPLLRLFLDCEPRIFTQPIGRSIFRKITESLHITGSITALALLTDAFIAKGVFT